MTALPVIDPPQEPLWTRRALKLAANGYNCAMEITVEVPDPLAGRPRDELATRARLLLVIDEVRAGRLTRAGAARALDMPLDAFLVEAGRHGLEAIDYDVQDFKRELATIPKAAR